MQFDTHGNGRGLDDLYVLLEFTHEQRVITEYLKSKGRSYHLRLSDVRGNDWYGRQFIDIPFGESLKETIRRLLVKDCGTCVYAGTHEECTGCLGTNLEIAERQASGLKYPYYYLFKNWVPGDGIARILAFERAGKRSIVIGGSGEAEVSVGESPEAALIRLCDVAEQCGYMVGRGIWRPEYKEIICLTEHHFAVRYVDDRLHSITFVPYKDSLPDGLDFTNQRVIWSAELEVEVPDREQYRQSDRDHPEKGC